MDPYQQRLFLAIGTVCALAIGAVLIYIEPCTHASVQILGANFESEETLVLTVQNTGERALNLTVLATGFGQVKNVGAIAVSAGQETSRIISPGTIDKLAVRDTYCTNAYAELPAGAITITPSL